MILNRRQWLEIAAGPALLAPLTAQATHPVSPQRPNLSSEMKILIESLRLGAHTDQEAGNGKPGYSIVILPDPTDPRPAPAGSSYFFSTARGKDLSVGLLQHAELIRAWPTLFGLIGGIANCPISATYAWNDFVLYFTRGVTKTVLGQCADRIIAILVDHELQRQQLIDSLPPLREV